MGSKERKYMVALALITIVVIIIRLLQPKPIDWSEGYSSSEKKPFGGYILYNELATLFPDRNIEINSAPIFELDPREKSNNQIFINSSFEIDQFETEILLNGVEYGNNVFISAWQFGGAIADSLNIRVAYSFPSVNPTISSLDSLIQNQVELTNQTLNQNPDWLFPVGLTESYFASFDTSNTTVLGRIDNTEVNFVRIDIGRGSVFIHTNPFLFTNNYLKDTNRFDYAFTALSYLPSRDVLWDEYYKVGRVSFSSPLSYVVAQPDLRRAWFISLIGLIVYLIFGAKRKQRIIPEVKSVSNTSIQFTSTVANLYLNNGTHKDILEKKILFFYDYVRTNLQVSIDQSDETILNISNRSGIDLEKISDLLSLIKIAQEETTITQKRLKQVTDQIDWFYKTSLR